MNETEQRVWAGVVRTALEQRARGGGYPAVAWYELGKAGGDEMPANAAAAACFDRHAAADFPDGPRVVDIYQM